MKRVLCIALLFIALPLSAETLTYRVLVGGLDTGHMIVNQADSRIAIDYDYKQNGRGPTIAEELTLDSRGYPANWTITGTTTFGSAVDEYFVSENGTARWQDTTGTGEAVVDGSALFYINQKGSPYAQALLIRALLDAPGER